MFLRELVSNASDAVDKLRFLSLTKPELTADDPIFSIRIKADPEAGTLSVIDNGIGIEDDMKEQVFLAFEQADNSYTRIYEGVGLGLAITRSIVSLHSGRVWIEDTAGGGTTVHMVLPVNAETAKEDDNAENLGC